VPSRTSQPPVWIVQAVGAHCHAGIVSVHRIDQYIPLPSPRPGLKVVGRFDEVPTEYRAFDTGGQPSMPLATNAIAFAHAGITTALRATKPRGAAAGLYTRYPRRTPRCSGRDRVPEQAIDRPVPGMRILDQVVRPTPPIAAPTSNVKATMSSDK
jgi:hypothetical protein